MHDSADPALDPALDKKDADVATGADGAHGRRRTGQSSRSWPAEVALDSDDEGSGGKTGDKTGDVGSDDGVEESDDESGGIKDAVATPGVTRHSPHAKSVANG